ncbi:hypothetical protein [Iodobacter fluviatilis]|uniref:Uncharacterized protein n=1 Tax=Iodobacter fluviatilis TaxID=537 RepID=A0A377Q8M5_9NEIS|nr:hypothetical protein [Iodobacter fluviatilis]TCU82389.1 hypothetical protein EV682_11528 [Iodobacter fluviatilis]STQ91614.1 Uncharacterised protein [Iodobacter fluviatilis]
MKNHTLPIGLALALLMHLGVYLFYQAKKPAYQTKRPGLQVFLPASETPRTQPVSPPPPPAAKHQQQTAKQKITPQTGPVSRHETKPNILEIPSITESGNAIHQAISPSARLDLSIPKENSSAVRTQSIIPGLKPQAETPRSELAKSLDKANRPDCKKAYSGLGLLAVVPLVADAVSDSGCQW